ncbi:MAG: hypothetical protein Q9227_000599 [Pyrenula ochraceoflavens]
MLSTRPSSSSGSQPHHTGRSQQPSRYNNTTSGGYRGLPSFGPVTPYAFNNTPIINHGMQPGPSPNPHLKMENRTSSAPVIPQLLPTTPSPAFSNPRYSTASLSNSSSSTPSSQTRRSQDDAAIPTRRAASADPFSRPMSTIIPGSAAINFGTISPPPARPSPDRYHRGHRQNVSAASVLPVASGPYAHPMQANSSPALQTYQSFRGQTYNAGMQTRVTSDDMSLNRQTNAELAKRYRRRSVGSLETAGLSHVNDSQTPSPHPNSFMNIPPRSDSQDWKQKSPSGRPGSSHTHSGSSESVVSTRSNHSSRPSSAKRDTAGTSSLSSQGSAQAVPVSGKQEVKLVTVPPRSTEPSKRVTNPSPLSRPMPVSPDTPKFSRPKTPEKTPKVEKKEVPVTQAPASPEKTSPAVQQLAELSKKDKGKSKSSKLRRAFSFGSAAELRKASAQNNMEKHTVNKRSSKYEDELEPEQAAIAERQEASGLGESIYSGQGNFFSDSTDNLSISSTASSASIMLRKMGKGVKKSTRSLVGLFRPKSVVGVPAADSPVVQASTAQVSMVTVEAEREKVNVNVDPHDQAGGGTGFPKLERNSLDAVHASTDSGRGSSEIRKSIVGGDRERAEVLAAVKKGILKRTDSGQASPAARYRDSRAPDFNLPQIPHVNDSPHSSSPSTPVDDQPPRSGHRRTDSVAIDGEDDYFSSITGLASLDMKGVPLTPSSANRNISFSPRIQFHDTWPSGEYDRRGEIATCNRLTPMLAQQIKEELNTFKMVRGEPMKKLGQC